MRASLARFARGSTAPDVRPGARPRPAAASWAWQVQGGRGAIASGTDVRFISTPALPVMERIDYTLEAGGFTRRPPRARGRPVGEGGTGAVQPMSY